MQDKVEVRIPKEIWDQVDSPEIDFGTPNNQAEWAQYADRLRCAFAEQLVATASLLARVAVLEGALREAESVFALVEHPSFPDPDYQMRIETLGEQIGYGALMSGASAAWRKSNIVEGSEFVAGPCQITVTRTLGLIRAALSSALGEG